MSDRIDELVATVRGGYPWQEYPAKSESHIALDRLAAIAREAEADRDEWIDRCYQSDERALKAEAMCEWLAEEVAMEWRDTVDNVLNDARRAVANER